MFKNRLLSSEKGYALAFALGIMVIMMLVGTMFTVLIYNEMLSFSRHKEIAQAYYLTEAGVNHALWNLNNGVSGSVASEASPISLGNGSYYTVFDSNSKLLTSIGKVAGVTKKITVHVTLGVTPGSFDRALSGAKFTAIHGDEISDPNDPWDMNYKGVFIHNATTDLNKVVVMSDGQLIIHGYVVNDEKELNNPPYDPEYLGYAYSNAGVGPDSKRYVEGSKVYPQAHWKDDIVGQVELPEFDTSSYEKKIASAKKEETGDVIWNNITKTYDPGTQVLISGDLTITGSTVQNSNPSGSAVEIVVFENVVIDHSTIGSNVTIIAGGGSVNDKNKLKNELALEIKGQNKNVWTTLGDECQFYSNGMTKIADYVRTEGKDTPDTSDDGEITIISKYGVNVLTEHDSSDTDYHINYEGIIFSKQKVDFDLKTNGGDVRIAGCVVAGSAGAVSPDGYINFGSTTQHRLDIIFFRGAVPKLDELAAFKVVTGAVLDYSTWRER
ncbi:hypothetical protein [Candidatus Oleimmundimicrobium sp.]|uniref:hypothetical protein n=1 Tax=Candidatus Oleimmundimicrobium sp. TaxID=3060597 RepID=UPI00271722AB|nr:hypothetical protein [Candidatus Oleimmundimicrobium sp.]MDO8886435.1 hypothetical protein [Candidatus Oleimmundimicrobium sp.]